MKLKNKLLLLIFCLLSASSAFADLDNERDLGGLSPKKTEDGEKKKDELKKPDLGTTPSEDPNLKDPATIPDPDTQTPDPDSGGKKPKDPKKKDNIPSSKHNDRLPIKWSAHGLKASKDGRQVDLRENVVVTQGDLKLVANEAKVFFNEQDDVEKIIAKGNVKMTRKAALAKDRISARGNKAIFYNDQQKVVLSGRATLWRSGDVVRGKQISYKVDTGWITVDNVEGVVQPGEVNSEQ